MILEKLKRQFVFVHITTQLGSSALPTMTSKSKDTIPAKIFHQRKLQSSFRGQIRLKQVPDVSPFKDSITKGEFLP